MRFVLTQNGMTQVTEDNINTIPGPVDLFDKMFSDPMTEEMKNQVGEYIQEIGIEILVSLKDLLVDVIGAVSLVGCGLLILLNVVGYDKGNRYAGILFTINVLVKYLFG
ncbi:MAG TPA: hypothetical protein VK982_15485 [Bacteroidales bacterium]|nr:hypothetical protein [Bacteroidales bacterium]